MKCVITGHTSGIGLALFNHFTVCGWEVVGVSRTNGYQLPEALDRVIDLSNGCDLFINNSYAAGSQLDLLHGIKRKAAKIVVCNTISRKYPFDVILKNDYVDAKKRLADACELISISRDDTLADVLLLDLSFMEGHTGDINNPKEITSDSVIVFGDVIKTIDFWLSQPTVAQISMKWKLTPRLYGHMIRASLPDHTHIPKEFKLAVDAV